MKNIIGTAKIINFCQRKSSNEFYTEAAHIALLLTFKDQELFKQYVENNNKIPYEIKINPNNNTPYYEVYFSLWAEDELLPSKKSSSLKDYKNDKLFIQQTDEWGDFNHLYKTFNPVNPFYTAELDMLIKQWQLNEKAINYIKSQHESYMLPSINKSSNQEEIFIPFIKDPLASNIKGLSLEATLKCIANIANNPKDFPYEYFGENAARMPLYILQAGLQLQPSLYANNQLEDFNIITNTPSANVLLFSTPTTTENVIISKTLRNSITNNTLSQRAYKLFYT